MSDEELIQETDLVSQLRDELDDEAVTAVVAPKQPLITRLKVKYSGLSRYKPYIVRGLAAVMALLVISQLIYQGAMAAAEYDGGPVPAQLAIEQLGDDLPPPPIAPPLP